MKNKKSLFVARNDYAFISKISWLKKMKRYRISPIYSYFYNAFKKWLTNNEQLFALTSPDGKEIMVN